jgi:peptide chain release factor 2
VKDLRTGFTSTNPDAVLDGGLDDFIQASLASKIHGTAGDVSDIE